jgi:hypothetical protein
VALSVTTALAHGRASTDLLSPSHSSLGVVGEVFTIATEIANIFSAVLLLSAIVSGGYNFAIATKKNRNPIIWFFKGLFGGPLAAAQLKELDSLQS